MKVVTYLAIVLTGFFVFAACQKEFSLESSTSARGSLKDTSGNCLPITVNGKYYVDSALTDSNSVVVQVNFTAAGTYNIYTDTSGGFSFQASGVVKDKGLQYVTLKGKGKPVIAQPTLFSVVFDSSVCTFTVAVAADTAGAAKAVYTLAGSGTSCLNSVVNGSYQQGTALNTTNTVTIQVNVDSIGAYAISAGPVNSMTFVAQGTFSATGLQTVILQGSGIPVSAGTSTVPVSAGGTLCNFYIAVDSSALPNLPRADSAWQFSEGANFFHGFDTAFTHIDTSLNNATALSFYGSSSSGEDTLFQIDILLPGNTVQTGTYNTDSSDADFFLYSGTDTALIYYRAYNGLNPEVNIQINISSYDASSKIVSGTFSGTAINQSGQKVNITGGKIYAKVE